MTLLDVDMLYKELYVRKGTEDWNEIVLNLGGVSSTLQDVKSQATSAAWVYPDIPNRFIYWTGEENVLEVREESLNQTLEGNQVRFKWTDSQLLTGGVSVCQAKGQICLLVPTLSTVHVFLFPRPLSSLHKTSPDLKKRRDGEHFSRAKSIFHGFTEQEATQSNTYLHYTHTSSVVSSCSAMTAGGEAVFALALADTKILVVTLDPLSEGSATRLLSSQGLSSALPRLFTNLTGALLGKAESELVGASLLLEYIRRELFLFALCRNGLLQVYSLDRSLYITSYGEVASATNNSHQRASAAVGRNVKLDVPLYVGGKHKLVRGELRGSLILHVCLQGRAILTLAPNYQQDGSFNFTLLSQVPIEHRLEVSSMTPGRSDGELWCCWLAPDESPLITKLTVTHPEFYRVQLTRPSLLVESSKYIRRDPASLYLHAIFSSGFFTPTDIAKALTLYKVTAVIKANVDISEQICSIVKSEISSEVGDQELDDDEFLDISHRCWSRLYSCCSQYMISSMLPLGMAALSEDTILLIQESPGFSLIVEMDPLELRHGSLSSVKKYGWILERIGDVNFGEALDRLELDLYCGLPLSELSILREASDLVPSTSSLQHVLSIFYEEDFDSSLNALIEELVRPEEPNKGVGDFLRSDSGIGAVASAFRQFISTRWELSARLVLLSELALRDDVKQTTSRAQYNRLVGFTSIYYSLLYFAKATSSNSGASFLHDFIRSHSASLMQPTIHKSVLALAFFLWPSEENNVLADYLLARKEFALLQTLARLNSYPSSWRLLLAESYLVTGQAGKAFDLCVKANSISDLLSGISLLERYARSDLVIQLAMRALQLTHLSQTDKETLESTLFVHELNLCNYDAVWSWIESCSSWSRRSDFLQRLVSSMIAQGKLQELLAFPYTGLFDEFEKFLSTRARSLPLAQANNYYNILYAFHMKHDNFKKASGVMLEKALRSESKEMEWRCYGICLSTLHLATSQSWLESPNPYSQEESIEIVQAEDIRREFELSTARCNLDDCSQDASSEEVVALCVGQKQFRTGLRLALLCKLSAAPIIQEFTASCIALAEGHISWHWLRLNEIDDILVTEKNALVKSWRVLERCIKKYEKPYETVLHQAAAKQLLAVGYSLPHWLLSSYKKLNISGLLRLYMSEGLLEEASVLAADLLQMALSTGPTAAPSPPLCPPLHLIQLLLLELKHYNLDENLEKTFNKYIETVMRLSTEREKIASSRS